MVRVNLRYLLLLFIIYLETAKLEARKEIRKNLIRYLARCSIEHLKRKTLAMCIHIW